MRARFRKLTDAGRFDHVLAHQGAGNAAAASTQAARAVVSAEEEGETEEMAVPETEASIEEVQALFARGELRPTDLVNVGQGWQTFDECYLFDDVAETYRRREAATRRARTAMIIAGALIGAFVLFAAIAGLRSLGL
jgi:hypothetical protein